MIRCKTDLSRLVGLVQQTFTPQPMSGFCAVAWGGMGRLQVKEESGVEIEIKEQDTFI